MADDNQLSGYILPPAYAKEFHDGFTAEPPPPLSGEVTVFGQPVDLNDIALTDESVPDILEALATKNKQALLLFLQLLRTLSSKPSAYSKSVNEINRVMQELLQHSSSLRPFQARATLEYALKLQLAEKQRRLQELRAQMDAALDTLSSLPQLLLQEPQPQEQQQQQQH